MYPFNDVAYQEEEAELRSTLAVKTSSQFARFAEKAFSFAWDDVKAWYWWKAHESYRFALKDQLPEHPEWSTLLVYITDNKNYELSKPAQELLEDFTVPCLLMVYLCVIGFKSDLAWYLQSDFGIFDISGGYPPEHRIELKRASGKDEARIIYVLAFEHLSSEMRLRFRSREHVNRYVRAMGNEIAVTPDTIEIAIRLLESCDGSIDFPLMIFLKAITADEPSEIPARAKLLVHKLGESPFGLLCKTFLGSLKISRHQALPAWKQVTGC